jgi:hypothetical protein
MLPWGFSFHAGGRARPHPRLQPEIDFRLRNAPCQLSYGSPSHRFQRDGNNWCEASSTIRRTLEARWELATLKPERAVRLSGGIQSMISGVHDEHSATNFGPQWLLALSGERIACKLGAAEPSTEPFQGGTCGRSAICWSSWVWRLPLLPFDPAIRSMTLAHARPIKLAQAAELRRQLPSLRLQRRRRSMFRCGGPPLCRLQRQASKNQVGLIWILSVSSSTNSRALAVMRETSMESGPRLHGGQWKL